MLQEELKNVKLQVDEFLREFFDEKKKGIGKIHPEVEKLIEEIEDVTLRGGDRFRPFMVYLGFLSSHVIPAPLYNGVNSSEIQVKKTLDSRLRGNDKERGGNDKLPADLLRLMCSTELLHSFALIHDDVIDKADMRRGGSTIKPDEKAILAGDLCFTFADELLNGFPVAVRQEYDTLREEVIMGEWMDVYYTNQKSKIKNQNDVICHPEECNDEGSSKKILRPSTALRVQNDNNDKENLHDLLMKIYRYKTVSYTILQPFEMGYKYSVGVDLLVDPHADRPGGLSLRKILIDIGIAFQMQDDYLDLFGDARFGKRIGGDLKEGKLTIWHAKVMDADRPSAFAKAMADKGGLSLQKYNEIFGNQTQTLEDVEYVKKLMIDKGIKKQIEEEMRDLVSSAKKEIEKTNINSSVKTLLREMAGYVVSREY